MAASKRVYNVQDDGWRIPEALWQRVAPLIPEYVNPDPLRRGRPPAPDRICLDAIFFVLRTGCQWNALNATGICPSSTAHDRFQDWVEAGIFEQLWERGLEEYDELKGLNWRWLAMDGCITKAPLGGEKNRPVSGGSGQGRNEALADHGRLRSAGRYCGWASQSQRLQADGRDVLGHAHHPAGV